MDWRSRAALAAVFCCAFAHSSTFDPDRLDRVQAACKAHLTHETGFDPPSGIYSSERMEQADATFRRQLADNILPSLRASADPDDRAAAIVLSRVIPSDPDRRERDSGLPQRELDALESILKATPDHRLSLALADSHCSVSEEAHPLCGEGLTHRLVAVAPSNGAYRVRLIGHYLEEGEFKKAAGLLDELPGLEFRSHELDWAWRMYSAALRHWPDPQPADQVVVAINAMGVVMAMSPTSYQPLYSLCDAEALVVSGATRISACRRAASHMLQQGQTLSDQVTATSLLEYALVATDDEPGLEALAEARIEYEGWLRDMAYVHDCMSIDLWNPSQQSAAWTETWLQLLSTRTEQDAHTEMIRHYLDQWAPASVDVQ